MTVLDGSIYDTGYSRASGRWSKLAPNALWKENGLFYFAAKSVGLSQLSSDGATLSFPVMVEELSWGWKLAMSGTSYARTAQSAYPKRSERDDLHASVRFRTIDQYRAFSDFVSEVHSLTLEYGPVAGELKFKCDGVGPGGDGILYGVVIRKASFSFSAGMDPAPALSLDMLVIRDEDDTEDQIGSITHSAQESVTSGSVAGSGDEAFR